MRKVLLAFLCAGCAPPAGLTSLPAIDDGDGNGTPSALFIDANPKVDLLFMVDNSNSMSAMSAELQKRFPAFLSVFVDLASNDSFADLNIGVITSDYGAGATGAPGCGASPGGQLGQLQALGVAADPACKAPVGAPFIHYSVGGSNNLPKGQDLPTTFTCMASGGTTGCGFEHQLESVYAALTNANGGNEGFLRDDARLMVVLITNEDDSSAPVTADIFDKNKTAQYGYEDSFRSTRFGILCGDGAGSAPPYGDSSGPIYPCRPTSTGGEFDIARYVALLTLPTDFGGIKNNPDDVFLAAIAAPDSPVQVILSNPGTAGGTAYSTCGQLNEQSNPPCVPVLQHSCQNVQDPDFFGDPSVRITALLGQVKHHSFASICDDDYSGAMQAFSYLLASRVGGCLPWQIDLAQPDCDVGDRAPSVDGTNSETPIARCSDGGALPCWEVKAEPWCGAVTPQSAAMAIHRGGKPAVDGTTTRVLCRSAI